MVLNFLCEAFNNDGGDCDSHLDCADTYFGILELDCADECGGTAEEDYCGVCNGANVANECEEDLTCPDGTWDCGDGQCIPSSFVCDGSDEFCNAGWGADCANGADEGLESCSYTDDCGSGCADGTVADCSGDGDCAPDYWVADGYSDGADQPYGYDLTCYENDGGDCDDAGNRDEDIVSGWEAKKLASLRYEEELQQMIEEKQSNITQYRNDCGGNGPDVGCDDVCFSGLTNDECGECNGDNSTCTGCTDSQACNYDETATLSGDCTHTTGCETCSGETDGSGTIVENDVDDDGVCDSDEVVGCQDTSACNYMDTATDADDCTYSTDLDDCASCSGDTDGTGTIVDNDVDNDNVCDTQDNCLTQNNPNQEDMDLYV